jgi:hypothetical protein
LISAAAEREINSYTLVHTGSGLTGFNKGRKNTTTRENFSQLIYYFCALELKFQRRTSNRASCFPSNLGAIVFQHFFSKSQSHPCTPPPPMIATKYWDNT